MALRGLGWQMPRRAVVVSTWRAGAPRWIASVARAGAEATSALPAAAVDAAAPPLASASPSLPVTEDEGRPGDVLPQTRRAKLKQARPFSDFLTDTFQRQHDYLRISLTERCNLRCLYCMPEEGVELSPARNLLTTPEIVLLADVFVGQGVRKIRLTGGEPTVRRDILPLMRQLGALRCRGLEELCLTTNGLALHRKLEAMVEAGLTGVNLSLDTLDPHQFQLMTRRQGLDAVRRSMDRILALNKAGAGVRLKINCVVMRGLNDGEMVDFVALTRDHDLEVRFIEYMPFDGNRWSTRKMVSFTEMLERLSAHYPTLRRTAPDAHHNGPHETSKTYEVPGFAGRVGFITSMTHNFCGGCNRLRVTSDGSLKVCLFGNAEVSLRDIVRRSNGGEPIDEAAWAAMTELITRDARAAATAAAAADGAEEHIPLGPFASDVLPNATELLDVIGLAVKRKKARHAGLGELEHMKNRPMILIDNKPRHLRLHGGSENLAAGWSQLSPRACSALSALPLCMNLSAAPQTRLYSTSTSDGPRPKEGKAASGRQETSSTSTIPQTTTPPPSRLTHVSPSGTAHMVSVADKPVTARSAAAACTVRFSSPVAAALVRANEMAKGDVLGVARVAGIMAAKRTADLIPLCHPLALSHVSVDVEVVGGDSGSGSNRGGQSDDDGTPVDGHVAIRATVRCEGKTGVEMEALTAAGVAAMTVFDMCKAVDKGMRIDGLRVVFKEGGKSGRWSERASES
ncbi:molybdenum cofactor biosynthesis protein 1 B [Niveomyces insectorum RCEF 264]|uniref:Molybdenum cofactor biosynthesis protein 1 B n=1 Tax=Niveomyces insectorum RCEF 264 TaxID=1081102 RepID=A0A162JF93_9HYPO|nr:molybdenum cofactor biosynthesis protein 1 B [Niveomyces insectorum RCEF 264]